MYSCPNFCIQLDADVRAAFDVAYANIHKFHAAQKKTQQLEVDTMRVGTPTTKFHLEQLDCEPVFFAQSLQNIKPDDLLMYFCSDSGCDLSKSS